MTVEEMQDALTKLNIEFYDTRGYEIQAECPAHEERTGHKDRNPSFYINADSGAFICFSCGWKGNLTTLVNYVSGGSADEWLKEATGLSARLNRVTRERPKIEEQTHITESMLSVFTTPPATVLASRGLTLYAAIEHQILWDERKGNWIITIRDPETNKLLGWQEKGHTTRFFRNYPTGVQKSKALFGFDKYKGGDMIVVESPLDVVRLSSLDISGGVATYGAIISKEQFNLIRGADRVIFAMDNDEAGHKSSMNLLTLCREMEKEAWFFNYGGISDVKDVGAMSKDEIVSGLTSARHITRGEKVI